MLLTMVDQCKAQQRLPSVQLFKLNASAVWTKMPPPKSTEPLVGAILPNFTVSVNQRDGSLFVRTTQFSTTAQQYAIVSTPLLDSVPKIDQTLSSLPAGSKCSERQLTITFSYLIPNNFSNDCADDIDGMEVWFLVSTDSGSANYTEGTGTMLAGGADIRFNTSFNEPYMYFRPTARAFIFMPLALDFCSVEQPNVCHIEEHPTQRRFTYGNYTTITVISINTTSSKMVVASLDAWYSNTRMFLLDSTKLQHYPIDARRWLGRQPLTSAPPNPMIYVVSKCVDIIVTQFTITSTDICTFATTSPLNTTLRTPSTTKTTLSAMTKMVPTITKTSTTTTATTIATTTIADSTTAVESISSTVSTGSNATESSLTSLPKTTLTTSLTSLPLVVTSTTDTVSNTVEKVVPEGMENDGGGDQLSTTLFVVFGVLLGCLFCMLLFCVFKKTIRRNPRVRRLYNATPGRRVLCCFLGAGMADEAGRGEPLMKDS